MQNSGQPCELSWRLAWNERAECPQSGISSRPDDPWHVGRWLRQELASAEDLGYFGPSSAAWTVHREAVLSTGLLRALLLQLAHPWVAQAVADHSTFQAE